MDCYHIIEIGTDQELVSFRNLSRVSAIALINSNFTNDDVKFNKVKVFKSETPIEEISVEMKTIFQLKEDGD